jgi:hypothetical protein
MNEPAVQVDIDFGQTDHFIGTHSLVNYQATDIVKIWMLGCATKVVLFLVHR